MALPIVYNWRNIFVRKTSTALTFGVVALIVFVLTWALAFGHGLEMSMEAGGSDEKIIVIKPGATGESTSILTKEEYDRLTQIGGLAVTAAGEVLRSGEVLTQISIPRSLRGGTQNAPAPVAVRGVEPIAFDVHPTVRIVAGRMFNPGTTEIIVGKAIQERLSGVDLNDELAMGYLGNRRFRIVGVFEAGGGPLESEIWGPQGSLKDAFGRQMLSSVALRARDETEAQTIIKTIKDPPYQLNAKTERIYYRDIAEKSTQIVKLTLLLVLFMGFGACFAVANTIYAAVDGRSREIAMLRTIGYSKTSVVAAFLVESLMICGLASVLGASVALFFEGQKQDFMAEATWSTFAYEVRVTPLILALSLSAAILVGIIGALVPAMRAARLDLVVALRQA